MKTSFAFLILILFSSLAFCQKSKINIVHSDNSTINEEELPGATILLGKVVITHEGASLKCTKAVHYKSQNYIKAYGNVVLNQGDSIVQTSNYTELSI